MERKQDEEATNRKVEINNQQKIRNNGQSQKSIIKIKNRE